jgi:hypothetical protein
VHRQACHGDECAHSEPHACNSRHDGHNDQEGCSLILEGPGPMAFGSNVHDVCFPKRFWALNNVVKYDSKINPSIWLEYCLACRVGGVDDDLFIIQFLPIYLDDMARA